jgi:hypothetical protein
MNSINTMSEEIDFLTKKNNILLGTIKKKDFFNAYEQSIKEVEFLRKQNN